MLLLLCIRSDLVAASMKIALTGANGFLGSEIFRSLLKSGHDVVPIPHSPSVASPSSYCFSSRLNIYDPCILSGCLRDCDSIVHAAGLAHLRGHNAVSFPLYYQANVDATLQLARAALRLRVNHFVLISSISVHGTRSLEHPISADSDFAPASYYAISKFCAEKELSLLLDQSDTSLTVLRPPLIYGSKAPGNFGSLLSLANKTGFLPFGGFRAVRSMIHIQNMVDIVELCCLRPGLVRNRSFVVSDGIDLSVSELSASILRGMGFSRSRLMPFNPLMISLLSFLPAVRAGLANLSFDLLVDSGEFRELTNWSTIYHPRDLVEQAARVYRFGSQSS